MNDSLFNLEPTKPTPLQSARRALADAERELAECDNEDTPVFVRAVNRFTELVKAEEIAELNKLQK